jgi:hypothetical protein
MVAFHHLNDQLFMPVSTLKEATPTEVTHADVENARGHVRDDYTGQRRPKTVEDAFWERKAEEAVTSGVFRSIQREGIVNPVEVSKQGRFITVLNGYHRIASADPHAFVPVSYKAYNEVEGLPVHYNRVDERPLHPRDDDND